MSRMAGTPDGTFGFSLIEVLVAMAIMGASLAVLYQIFSVGLHNTGVAEKRTIAAVIADSKLAELSGEPIDGAFEESGESSSEFRWIVEAEPFVPDGLVADTPPKNVVMYQVSVAVHWDDGGATRSLRLRSLRVYPSP